MAKLVVLPNGTGQPSFRAYGLFLMSIEVLEGCI